MSATSSGLPISKNSLRRRRGIAAAWEWAAERIIWLAGISAILILLAIMLFLFREGLHTITHANNPEYVRASMGESGVAGSEVTDIPEELDIPWWAGLRNTLLGRNWYPISTPHEFGFLPLLFGSGIVTLIAVLISLPFGILGAVYIAEIAPKRLRMWIKSGIELIVAIPSVVLGFVGLFVLVPMMQQAFGLQTGLCAMTGAVTLAFMALPTIVSIAEDAISAVPNEYREASLAMGAGKWETIVRVILPAASSGIVAAVMLGIGRAIGETMAVLMVTGNAGELPKLASQLWSGPPDPKAPEYNLPWVGFMSVRTMPATIGAEMGETVQGDPHYHALFAAGGALFLITFAINAVADISLGRARKRGVGR